MNDIQKEEHEYRSRKSPSRLKSIDREYEKELGKGSNKDTKNRKLAKIKEQDGSIECDRDRSSGGYRERHRNSGDRDGDGRRRKTEKNIVRDSERDRNPNAEPDPDPHPDLGSERDRGRDRDLDRHHHRDRDRDRNRHRNRGREYDVECRERENESERQRERDREKERERERRRSRSRTHERDYGHKRSRSRDRRRCSKSRSRERRISRHFGRERDDKGSNSDHRDIASTADRDRECYRYDRGSKLSGIKDEPRESRFELTQTIQELMNTTTSTKKFAALLTCTNSNDSLSNCPSETSSSKFDHLICTYLK